MEAVIFDMDGVIVDSERYWHRWEEDVFPAFIEEKVDADAVMDQVTGINYREMYDLLADRYTTTVDRQEFVDRFDARARTIYTEKVSLMQGFGELVAAIRGQGCKTALVSSSPRHWIEMVRDRFDPGPFDVVISADELLRDGVIQQGKPDPAVYRVAADRLDVPPEACIVVEDSANGVEAATTAGMYCIAYGAENVNADESVAGPAELREAIMAAL